MKLHLSDELDPKATLNVPGETRGREASGQASHEGLPTGPSARLVAFRYWMAIRRYAWQIGVFMAVTVAFTTFMALRIPKEYEATATIRVDPSVPADLVGNQSGNSGAISMGPQLSTDMKEIVSPAVVTPAMMKVGMLKASGDNASAAHPSANVGKVMSGIKVSEVGGTYLLNISYRSASPSRASAVANALAQEFIKHEYATRDQALRSLSQYMREQIQELRERMNDSQRALNSFERDNNIVNPDSKSSSFTGQLSSLQQELGTEQSKQRSLDANLALAKEGNVDALLVSDRGNALAPLLQARQQAAMDFASLASKYGPGNYLYQQQQRKLAQIDKAIQTEQGHVAAQIEAQARAAAVQVELTRKKLAEVKAQLNGFNRKGVQFAILKQKAETDKTLYNDLLERMDSADVTAGYHSTALRITSPARPNSTPVSPRVKPIILFAFLLSGFLGILGAIAVGEMDRTLRDPEDVADALGVELLGFLPELKDGAELNSLANSTETHLNGMRTPFAEALSGIRSTLQLRRSLAPVRALAVISSQPKEGKTTLAINLAASFAALGKRTVIVDGDLLRPTVHRALKVSNRAGLSSVLLGQARLDEVLRSGPTEHLTVLPAGPPSAKARELVANGVEYLIEELKAQFDVVIFDTPPVLGFADTLNIAAAVDETVLVVRAGKTPSEYVQVALEQLRHVQASVAGVVLNGIKSQSSRHYYWYSDSHFREYASANGSHDSSL